MNEAVFRKARQMGSGDEMFEAIIAHLVSGYANQNDPCANCHKRRYEHVDHYHEDPCVFGDCGDFE